MFLTVWFCLYLRPTRPSSSLSTVHADLQLNPAGKLKAARSNLKSEPQRTIAADMDTDYRPAELTSDKSASKHEAFFIFESLSWLPTLYSLLLSDQMVTGGALAGGSSATWEDIKSSLRDEDNVSHLLLRVRAGASLIYALWRRSSSWSFNMYGCFPYTKWWSGWKCQWIRWSW